MMDVYQDTLLALYLYKKEVTDTVGLAFGIAKYKAIERLRAAVAEKKFFEVYQEHLAPKQDTGAEEERIGLVLSDFRKLPKSQQDVLTKRASGKSREDIAKEMGFSPRKVKRLLEKARKQLR